MTENEAAALAAALPDRERWHEVTEIIYALLEREGCDGISDMEADLRERFGAEIARLFWERAHDQTIAFLDAGTL